MAVEEKKTRRVRKKLWKNDPVTITFANKDSICIDTDNDIFITDPKEIEAYLSPREIGNLEMVGSDGNPNDYLSQPYPNLLLKGNNLIALHSLKSRFQNKVKLIYIDPPYNTGNDSFNYNDRFNHSTWLTFMKNRLEIARDLLRDDGVIFVQCDDNEQAYLKVLMDEIFGARRSKDDSQNNFVGCVVVKMSESSGVKMSHTDARFAKLKEFILVYKKNKIRLNASKVSKENLDKFSSYAKYYSKIIENIDDSTEDWKIYPLNDYLVKNNLKLNDDEILDFKLKNAHRMVYRTNNKSFKNLNIRKPIAEIVSSRGKKYIWWEGKQMLFLEDYLLETIGDLWTDISSINLNKEGDCDFKNAKKPEKLLHRIIDMTTNEGDLVLDFFAGSGTTLAVAHKMGRRWIGVEQMDYVESITKERLKKVIEGEQGGVSKAVEWNGGGEFVYAEIIDSAPNTATLQALQDCELEQKEDKIYNNFEDYLKDLENDK